MEITETQAIDWMADRYAELRKDLRRAARANYGALEFDAANELAHHISRMFYYATGLHMETTISMKGPQNV